MGYRYLALVDSPSTPRYVSACSLTGMLQKLGMRLRHRIGDLALFASDETPVLSLTDGTAIVGDIYRRDGQPVLDPSGFQPLPERQAFREQLLERCWGDYLLIQSAEHGSDGLDLMRSPSGDMACAYSLDDGRGFITSDLSIASQLGLHQDRIDWDFIGHCLLYPHIKISRTGLVGIRELLPGCMLSIEGRTLSTTLAWSPWTFTTLGERQLDPSAAALAIREATTTVVRAMAETDRSLLLELSGGLDSSIVGVCLAEIQAQVACCTAITPLPGADERHYAGQVAAYLGVELLQQELDFKAIDIDFLLPRSSLRPAVWVLGHAVARAMDEAANLHDVHSHFSGSGGDSVFGYLTNAAPAADAFRDGGLATGCRAIANLSKLHGCTIAKAARLTLRKLFQPPKPPYKADATFLTRTDMVPPLELHPWFNLPSSALPGDRERIFDLAGNQLFVDATLRAGGRRVRMPLLSQPVMEACLRVPSWMWIDGGRNRAVARSAFASQLPEEVLNRRSKGTFMNYTFAVYLRNKEAIRRFLLDGHLQARGLLDQHKLNLFLDTPRPTRDRSFMRIFDLCMIENWVRNHG